jgi:hypothetical protein
MSFRDMRGFPRVVNAVGSDMGGMIARSVLVDSDLRHVPRRRAPLVWGQYENGSGFIKSGAQQLASSYWYPNQDQDGNEILLMDSMSGSGSVGARTPVITGKRYWEVLLKKRPSAMYTIIGVMTNSGNPPCAYCSNGWGIVSGVNGNSCGITNGTGGANYNGNQYSDPNFAFKENDIIGVACNADNGRVWFSRNGQWTLGSLNSINGSHPSKGELWINSAFQMSAGPYYFFIEHYTCFTGGGPFVYEVHSKASTMVFGPPEGFLPMDNLPP